MDNNESDILLPDDVNRNARTELNGPSTDLIDHDTHVPFPSTNNNNSIMPVERGTSLERRMISHQAQPIDLSMLPDESSDSDDGLLVTVRVMRVQREETIDRLPQRVLTENDETRLNQMRRESLAWNERNRTRRESLALDGNDVTNVLPHWQLNISQRWREMPRRENSFDRLPQRVITQNDLSNVEKCLICLDGFILNSIAKMLPCEHFFHLQCLQKWVQEYDNKICPLCRAGIHRR
jgi:hypothetical protein